MDLLRHATGAALLERGGELLRRRETLHSLILMLAARPIDPAAPPPYFATVEDEGGVALVVLRTPPHNLVLSALREEADTNAVLDRVVADFTERGEALPGVSGHAETVLAFAPRWEAANAGIHARVLLRLAAFELDAVRSPPADRAPAGRARKAVATDLDLVFDWCNRFVDETGLPPQDRPRRDVLAGRIERGAIWLWDVDGVAVTMAASATGNIARIGGVYTPPEHRRRGFASACVAHVSQALLDAGATKVTLSADVANPTSNKIYEAIGYRRIGDEILIKLDPRYPSRASIARAAALAKIAHDAWMQDWPIEVSDGDRLEEFLSILDAYAGDWELTYWFVDLVLDSARMRADCAAWSERLTTSLVAAWSKTKAWQLRERLEYWACGDAPLDESFEVTPAVRAALVSIGAMSP